MSAAAILRELRRRGVELRQSEGRIRFWPAEAVPPDLLDGMRLHKPHLLELLAENHEWTLEESAGAGRIMPGWTPRAWADELRRKARCCEATRLDIAAAFRRWADNIDGGRAGE